MTTSRLLEENVIEEPHSEKDNIKTEEEFMDNLVIYYFDHKKGPTMFYSSSNPNFGYLDPKRFLDVVESGTFILALQNYQTLNHIFSLQSAYARGRHETLMISYIVKNPDIEDIFRHLKSKTLVLEEFEEELKNLEDLPYLLHNLDETSFLCDLSYEDFSHKFLETYRKFYEKLSLKFKILKPINELRIENIDTYCIKLYLNPEDLSYALNAMLLNRKVSFTINKDFQIEKKIQDFFIFIFADTFKIDLSIKLKKFYKKNNELLLIEKKPSEIIKYKNVKEIVKDFYSNNDSISSLIFLRDKIRELYVLSKRICDYYELEGKPEFLYRKVMIKDLEKVFYVKVNKEYFSYLDEIVKKYHGIEIVWVQEYIADKIEEMWAHS